MASFVLARAGWSALDLKKELHDGTIRHEAEYERRHALKVPGRALRASSR